MRPSEIAASGSRRTRNRAAAGRDDQGLVWWQSAVFYEIATISFQDSNGDGKGDLAGLLSRIDYLEWLGVDAVWLTPIYPSPMLDLGYDISDFCDVHPAFGTLDQVDEIVKQLHGRDIRLILDFVPNHTSDQHAWFMDSRSSRGADKRNWFIWSDPGPNGGPPNNWQSRFSGSAWQWDQTTGQYYYHSFLREQPDLNWRNPDVRAAMAEVLRFWMRRGVDGFRVDASAVLGKDELLRDNPPDPEAGGSKPPPQRFRNIFTDDRPEAMTYLADMRKVIDEFEGRVVCGEVQGKTDRIGHFYGHDKPRLHLPLNFLLLDSQWDAISLQGNIDAYLNAIPDKAWPDWVIGGHDKHRIASKLGQAQTRVLAMLVLTLRGTPFLFAGDELGMEQVPIPPDRVTDPFEKLLPGYDLNRDPERVPMRWDHGANAGFSEGEPWLPLGKDVERNVAALIEDKQSLLWLYKQLIALRRTEPSLTAGAYVPVRSRNDLLIYRRAFGDDSTMIALNPLPEARRLDWQGTGRVLLSTHLDGFHGEEVQGPLLLRPDEGLIIKLS